LPPPSGEIKPKPLLELKNFTVPIVMIFPSALGYAQAIAWAAQTKQSV
jgi:hypothetical protein